MKLPKKLKSFLQVVGGFIFVFYGCYLLSYIR